MCEALKQKEVFMLDAKSLQKYSLFGGLMEDQIGAFLPMMVQEKYNPGDAILVEGTPNDKIFFIVEGRVSVSKSNTAIYDMAEGCTFGEMEVLDVMPSAATIKAVGNVTVMTMSIMAFREIYKNDIKTFSLLLMNLARDLSRRLRIANDMMIDGKTHSLYSSKIFMENS
jgi:CRP-like cAMP-binding protein